jgi:hypothetical protein
MIETATTCEHFDIALSLMQTVRERSTLAEGSPPALTLGEPCGDPSVGCVETDGTTHHFCARHALVERIVRD